MFEIAGRRILNAHDVARLFKVSHDTVLRWDRAGKLDPARTEWAHRYSETAVMSLMSGARR